MDLAEADALNGSVRTVAIKHRTLTAAAFARLGLHPGQESVLFALRDHGSLTQAQLGAHIGCEPSSVTGMVQKLEAGGLLERRRAERDARVLLVRLTVKGRQVIPSLERVWIEIAEAATQGLSVPQRRRVTEALEALAAGLSRQDTR